jgi:hypothetical protein
MSRRKPSSSSPTDYHVPPAICHLPLTDCLPIATAMSRHFELSSHRATYQHCNLISAFAPVFTRARYTNVHFTVPREGSLSGVNIRTFRVACNGKMLYVQGPLQLNGPLSLVGRPSRRHCLNSHPQDPATRLAADFADMQQRQRQHVGGIEERRPEWGWFLDQSKQFCKSTVHEISTATRQAHVENSH